MRLISSVLAAVLATGALTTGVALAADTGPLKPGAPAGVKQAQSDGRLVAFGLGAVAFAAIIIAVTQDDDNPATPTPPATTTTTTTV